MPNRLVLIEDEPAILQLVAKVVKEAGMQVVAACEDAESGIEAAVRAKPDVAVVDLMLPRISGEDAITEIHKKSPDTKIIALTAVNMPARILNALRLGATGYLIKPFRAERLLRAIDQVLEGEIPLSAEAAKAVMVQADLRSPSGSTPSGSALSDRELEVLELLCHGHTYASIAKALGIQHGTVQTYIKRLYEKLQVSSKAEATLVALTQGLVKAN
jgi:two-component system, NarL family, nitrate/nitrite response regulator NarL